MPVGSCRRSALALAIASLSSVSAYAQAPLPSQGALLASATELTPVVVSASPLSAQGELDLSLPASVLRGDALRQKEGTSLGATLANEVGVQSSAYGAGAGRPIIRGMDSARVLVTESGIGVADVSGASPDHRVAADTLNARQIEVLRGPATLLYGSGAIGGLVNVVQTRVPDQSIDRWQGNVNVRAASAEDEWSMAVDTQGPLGPSAVWRVEGFKVDSGDYRLAESLRDAEGNVWADRRLPNSQTRTEALSAGASWFATAGWLGAAVQHYSSDYGIPNPEEPVTIRLKRDRLDARSEWQLDQGLISAVRWKASYTDYEHTEYEPSGDAGAHFTNQGVESRLELAHKPWAGWSGTLGVQIHSVTTEGAGEGVLPKTNGRSMALFAVEERRWDAWRVEAGARYEATRFDVKTDASPDRRFDLFTGSLGAFWRLAPDTDVGLSVSRSQRAPAVEELYFVGAHPATFAYEIGNPDLKREQSVHIEWSLRRVAGPLQYRVAVFQDRFRDYIYGSFDGSTTDLVGEDGTVEETLSNLAFRQDNARFRGIEAELKADLGAGWSVRPWGDLVRAVLTSGPHAGDNLPRIAPARLGLDIDYQTGAWKAGLSTTRVMHQNRVAAFDVRDDVPETSTAGYTLVGAHASWDFGRAGQARTVYLQARNLTNVSARVHTSFLKDYAPLAGRSIVLGMRMGF